MDLKKEGNKMTNYQRTKKRAYEIIEKGKKGDRSSTVFDGIIVGLIVVSITSIIVESFEAFYLKQRSVLYVVEIFTVVVFSIEYLLRLWTAEHRHPNKSKLQAMILFVFSFMGLIDLFAIIPFYLPMLIAVDLRFLRVLRLLRIFRLLKLNRYIAALNIVGKVIKAKKEELAVTFFVTLLVLLLASSLMYYIEHDRQPDLFPNIISSFWWAIATLTTVGYGDVYPVTGMGRFLSGIIAIFGIGLVALPTGILSSGFVSELSKKEKASSSSDFKYCPHCGKQLQ